MQDERKRQEVMQALRMQGQQNPELFLLVFNVQFSSVGKYLLSYHVLNRTEVTLGLKRNEPAYKLLDIFLKFKGEDCSEKVLMIDYDTHCLNLPSFILNALIDGEETRTSFEYFEDNDVYKCYHNQQLRYMEIDINVGKIPKIQSAISLLSKVPFFKMKLDWMFVLNSDYKGRKFLPEKILASYFVKSSL